MNTDRAWYLRVNAWAAATPWLHPVLTGYAVWAGLCLLAVLLIGAWWRARRRGTDAPRAVAVTVLTGLGSVVALLINQLLISPAIARPRPCQALAHVEVLLPCSADYSMPSDHCVIAGAFVAGLWLLHRRLGVVAGIAALLLAFSRVYVGVHYPADTLLGLLCGAVIATVIVVGGTRTLATLMVRLARTRYAVLVEARSGAERMG